MDSHSQAHQVGCFGCGLDHLTHGNIGVRLIRNNLFITGYKYRCHGRDKLSLQQHFFAPATTNRVLLPLVAGMSSWNNPGWGPPPRYMTPIGDPRIYTPNQPAVYSPTGWISPTDPYHTAGSQLSESHRTHFVQSS